MEANDKQMKKVAWKIYKTAKPVFFGDAESDKLRKACEKLRAIADSGKLPAGLADELVQRVAEIDRSGLSPEVREAFAKWYMSRFGVYLIEKVKEAQNAVWGGCGMMYGLAVMRVLFGGAKNSKIQPLSLILFLTGLMAVVTFITWGSVALFLKKHKQLLFKYLGPDCLSRK